uniref:Uncharacterized protein n=1 Tax=Trypanosoma congolense (strain IL3000) TaxID=1068625 RepID=G0UU46_TRYCI|nr:hypothetical protein, unlikely [Trypanosoma congolense IL3000]
MTVRVCTRIHMKNYENICYLARKYSHSLCVMFAHASRFFSPIVIITIMIIIIIILLLTSEYVSIFSFFFRLRGNTGRYHALLLPFFAHHWLKMGILSYRVITEAAYSQPPLLLPHWRASFSVVEVLVPCPKSELLFNSARPPCSTIRD